MRILTYKRTHKGDPSSAGDFGINDCMRRVRDFSYDAVIGVGGIGAEARSNGIDERITWVGINPTKRDGDWRRRPLVSFQHFVLWEEIGHALDSFAPALAKRMYQGKVRYLIKGYSNSEQAEAEQIIAWAMTQPSGDAREQVNMDKGGHSTYVCNKPKGKTPC